MKRVDFAEFFAVCKDRLTDTQLRALEPSHEYFVLEGGGYIGLDLSVEDSAWVSILVGEMADIWAARRFMVQYGVKRVGFACRPGSVTAILAKYYGAEVRLSDQTYSDGGARLDCVVYTQQTQRLKKAVRLAA